MPSRLKSPGLAVVSFPTSMAVSWATVPLNTSRSTRTPAAKPLIAPFPGVAVESSLHCQNFHVLQGLTLAFDGGEAVPFVCQAATHKGSSAGTGDAKSEVA